MILKQVNNLQWRLASVLSSKALKLAFSFTFWFSLKQKNQRGGNNLSESIEIIVFQYYVEYSQIQLEYSADFPCLDVGKPKRHLLSQKGLGVGLWSTSLQDVI